MNEKSISNRDNFELFLNQYDTILIFTKSNCKYCKYAIELCKNYDINANIINIDFILSDTTLKNNFLNIIQSYNYGNSYKTFPIIFVHKKFIGGYNELNTYLQRKYAFNEDITF